MIEIKVVTLCRKCETMYEGNLLFQKCRKCGNPMYLVIDAKGIIEGIDNED